MRMFPIITLSVTLLLTGCATRTSGPTDLAELTHLKADPPKKERHQMNQMTGIRKQAITETAHMLGSQYGLIWRTKQINRTLDNHEQHLSQIYNFRALEIKHNVLPPVLVTSNNEVNLPEDKAIRTARKTYKIISAPHFVTTAQHWGTYLKAHYSKPEKPNDTLLPKNKEEIKLWNQTITTAWTEGIHQAEEIFTRNLARLSRDYKGMALYHALLAQHMITPTYIATTELGITSDDSGNEMRINDQVQRITSESILNPHSNVWRPTLQMQQS